MRRFQIRLALFLGVLLAPWATLAQPLGSGKLVRIIAFAPPGGSLDMIARTLAQGFGEFSSKQAFVENKPGASGNIAMMELARSAPDGMTIGLIAIGTHGLNPALYGKKLPYDPVADFVPISLVVLLKNVLVVNPSVPAKNIPEFVAYLKANPNKVSYASSGVGSAQHLAAELFKMTSGTQMIHVPYAGTSKALPMVMSNEVQAMFVPIPEAIAHIKSGEVRALGVTSKERAYALPDVPTIAEQGYPNYDLAAWVGLAAPKGTPAAAIDRYSETVRKILAKPDVVARLSGLGMDIKTDSPSEFAAYIQDELAKWPPVVKAAGASVE
jgi:tripartite-type tricarboxylate transporter receptor subunit TctC